MRNLLLLSVVTTIFFTRISAQDSTSYSFEVGVKSKKYVGFYWENGISAEFKSPKIINNRVALGFNLVSSRLGSAFRSAALPTLETEFSAIYYFRYTKSFQPLVRLNAGLAHVNYGSSLFNSLTQNAPLISLEVGVSYSLPTNLRMVLSGGYNILSGNGSTGLGSVYPIYSQFSLLYKIK